jgi:hypothetical protein
MAIEWRSDWEKAKTEARERKLPIFLFLSSPT